MSRGHIEMTGAPGRGLRSRPGQSLVEFVLIMPLLLLLMMGIVEFARGWNIRHVVTDAAREAARTMAVDNGATEAQVMAVIENALAASGLDIADADVDLVWCASATCASSTARLTGEPASATIVYHYELGVVRLLLGWAIEDGQLDIGTSFVMRNE